MTTSGLTPDSSNPNQRPGASEPGLDLVDHHQGADLVAQLADPAEVLVARRVHATLALDRLDQHGGDRTVDRGPHRIEVAPRHVTEPFGHRLERLVFGRLAGGRERRQGASVEAAERADHRVTAPATVLAGQLDRALDRLGTRVREEDLPLLTGRVEQQLVHGDRRLSPRPGW